MPDQRGSQLAETDAKPAPPAISVILPVFNGERFLAEAVESILGQSFSDFEFIIIDDGSTDRTAEILRGYDDRRIRLLPNPRNLGLTQTLNIGLEVARGRFIARMDADDIALPDRLARQMAYFDAHPDVVLVGAGNARSGHDARSLAKATRPLSPAQFRWQLLFWSPILHPSAMFRAALVREHGLRYDDSAKSAEDYDMWIRMTELGAAARLPGALVLWRRHDDAIGVARRAEQTETHKRLAIANIERQFPALEIHREKFEQLLDIHLNPRSQPLSWRGADTCATAVDLLYESFISDRRHRLSPRDLAAVSAQAGVTLYSVIVRSGEARRKLFLLLRVLFRLRRYLWSAAWMRLRSSA